MMMKPRKWVGLWVAVAVVAGIGLFSAGVVRAYAPAGRYVTTADTVLDTTTQLTWQRAASATTYTWAAAQTYCTAAGWRLPMLKELQSLVDIRRSNPSIDPVAFPNTPTSYFWSASPLANGSGFAWLVLFVNGYAGLSSVDGSYSVRCVR